MAEMETPRLPDLDGSQASIEATVVRTLYANEENGWSAVRCRGTNGVDFTAVGTLLGIRDGDRLRLSGRWVQHARFGEQLEVATWVPVEPTTLEGIRRYLGSGRVRGIGPKTAERIVEAFGLDSLEVLEHSPDRLRRIRGIGAKTLARIKESWSTQRGIQQLLVFLAGHGVPPGVAAKAHARYGATALEVVRGNPYRLAEDVFGVGFRTADRIARNLGIPADAPQRREAGLGHVLAEATGDGHVFLPRDVAFARAGELLEAPADELQPALEALGRRGLAVTRPRATGEPAVYPRRLEEAEAAVVEAVKRLVTAPRQPPDLDVRQAMGWFQAKRDLRLADRQLEALASALIEPIVVITGGPGTGKTTLIRGVIDILRAKSRDVLLAAPTGRAAKRLAEATGAEARTLHRLLEFNPQTGGFARDRGNPLDADVIVVDEVSMLDIELARHLLEAVESDCRLVLVGDADQLPSVGPGNVLGDLIDSDRVRVIRLTEIFRQAEQSSIVVNAHRINQGEMPLLRPTGDAEDFYFVERDDPVDAADLAIDFACRRIPARFGLDPIDGIQVLTPMHRGELGVTRLNERMQALLVPPGPELAVGSRRFRVGDKVMQIRNNYDLDIFNGDIGRVVAIDPEEQELVVRFEGSATTIPPEGLDDLVPAYACTIHKSQGSEYPAVVVVLHHHHHVMLQRNLLYTAVTRGRRLVVIVGTRRALGRAVRNATVRERYTLLADRLREALPDPRSHG